jgi:propanediol dehydratase small subunit
VSFDPTSDYPVGSQRPDLVVTASGRGLDELVLEDGGIEASELRAAPSTLRLQAEVARAAGRSQLADNLLRAAELASLPDETILGIYTALRPRRSTAADLEHWAARLDALAAPATAAFVRAAADAYARRGQLAA